MLNGEFGVALGLAKKKVVLPWTTEGIETRQPPDSDIAVDIFADALPTIRACWESVVAQFAIKNREYLIYRDEASREEVRITYQQCARMVEQLAWSLIGLGAKKGDRIGLAIRNYRGLIVPSDWTDPQSRNSFLTQLSQLSHSNCQSSRVYAPLVEHHSYRLRRCSLERLAHQARARMVRQRRRLQAPRNRPRAS